MINWAIDNADKFAKILDIEVEEAEENKAEEAGEDKVAAMKATVDLKSNDKEKVDEWIIQLKEQEGKENPLAKANFFSRVSILRLLKPIILLTSLAESSREASKLLLKVLSPQQIIVLIRLSALGTSQTQCIIQRIFQTLLRCNIKLDFLNKAVATAAQDDSTKRVDELHRKQCLSVDLKSSFWTFNFNQIYLARRA